MSLNFLYWLVVVLILVAIPLALLMGVVLVRELLHPEPTPASPALPVSPRHQRPKDHQAQEWVEDLRPTRTPPVPEIEHDHRYDSDGRPVPCWCDWGTPMRARPYTSNGQEIVP